MRLKFDPEHALPAAAICLGLAIGAGFMLSSTTQGCATSECTVPANAELPVSVLDCPTGTLCYRGACLPSCASGAEGVEMCESDSDCSSAARPNCVDRRCSSCETGQRCIPSLNICSSVRPNAMDGGSIIGDSGRVSGVKPLDGGPIDGSVLIFETEEEPPPPTRPQTHAATIELNQRTDLTNSQTLTSSATARVTDLLASTRVTASATVTDPVFPGSGERCELRTRERFAPHVRIDMGDIRLEPDMNAPGLAANLALEFDARDYAPTMPLPPAVLLHSSSSPNYARVNGAGMMGINGPWPPGTGTDIIAVPERFVPAPDTLTALRAGVDFTRGGFEVVWTRTALSLPGIRVEARIATDTCELICTSDTREEAGQLLIPEALLQRFHTAPCSATNPRFTVDRVSSRRLNAASDESTGALVLLSVTIRDGYIVPVIAL